MFFYLTFELAKVINVDVTDSFCSKLSWFAFIYEIKCLFVVKRALFVRACCRPNRKCDQSASQPCIKQFSAIREI